MSAMMSQIDCLHSRLFKSRTKKITTSLASVMGIHRGLEDSPQKGPVARKMSPFDDVIMICRACPKSAGFGCVFFYYGYSISIVSWCVQLMDIKHENLPNKIKNKANKKQQVFCYLMFLCTIYLKEELLKLQALLIKSILINRQLQIA